MIFHLLKLPLTAQYFIKQFQTVPNLVKQNSQMVLIYVSNSLKIKNLVKLL